MAPIDDEELDPIEDDPEDDDEPGDPDAEPEEGLPIDTEVEVVDYEDDEE